MSTLGFKARVDPLHMCFLACAQWLPQIHLWCDTCQPLGGQHGSQSRSLHASGARFFIEVIEQIVSRTESTCSHIFKATFTPDGFFTFVTRGVNFNLESYLI